MNNELYHYGVPGMKWGTRKAKPKTSKAKPKTSKTKPKMSNGKKIAIGSAIAVTALAGVGTMLAKDFITKKVNTLLIGKAIAENMW